MPDRSGIFYTDLGNGFPVILIHGFCETHEIWDSFSKTLSKEYRIICLDLPGFGKSTLLPDGFSIDEVAAKLLALLSELKIEQCIVVGHSLGGYVALAMAAQQSAPIKAFGLFHSTAYPDTEERKSSRNKVIEFVSNYGVATFIESFIPPLFYDQTNPYIKPLVKLASGTSQKTLLAYVKAMRDRPDRTNVLEKFNGPILFIGGENDGGISPESVKKQAKLALKPTIHILREVAHVGMFEDEKTTLRLVREFLGKSTT